MQPFLAAHSRVGEGFMMDVLKVWGLGFGV